MAQLATLAVHSVRRAVDRSQCSRHSSTSRIWRSFLIRASCSSFSCCSLLRRSISNLSSSLFKKKTTCYCFKRHSRTCFFSFLFSFTHKRLSNHLWMETSASWEVNDGRAAGGWEFWCRWIIKLALPHLCLSAIRTQSMMDELPQFFVFNPLPLLLFFFVTLLRFQLLPRLHDGRRSIPFFGQSQQHYVCWKRIFWNYPKRREGAWFVLPFLKETHWQRSWYFTMPSTGEKFLFMCVYW